MDVVTPGAIRADRTARVMTVSWSDGHESMYPFGLLRAACPCAQCRGGHENMRPTPDEGVFHTRLPLSAQTRLTSIEAVGSYAINLAWEDGHHHGHYTWAYLRALCPCAECRKK